MKLGMYNWSRGLLGLLSKPQLSHWYVYHATEGYSTFVLLTYDNRSPTTFW